MNKIKTAIKLLLFGFVILMFVSSCKTTKSTLKKPLKDRGFDFLYSKMKKNQIKADYFKAKLTIVYYQEKKSKTILKGQLRIKMDSIIWLSISPALGIEALRLEMTQDSVKIINRLNKTYVTGNYKMVENVMNTTIDYSIVEALLFANDLSQYDIKKFKVKVDDNLYNISIRKRRKLKKYLRQQDNFSKILVQDFWIDPFTYRIRKMKLNEFGDNSKSLFVYYDNYELINGRMLPMLITIDVFANKKLQIEIKYKKPEFDNPLTFPFKIPQKYKEMKIE